METLPTIPDGKMKRPTISLALIAKNEEKNVNRLLDSVEGCVDEVIFVDTGSTDSTKMLAEARGCKVYDFEWVNSFSKARNFAFSKSTKEYILWLDLDDVLFNKDAFIQWRDSAMEFQDFWFATYHYAVDEKLNPLVSFVRERVMKRSINPTWQYDLHEGIIPKPEWSKSYITTWAVKHLRDADDIKADRSRNITLLESLVKAGNIDARMQFYYGKELYEANRPSEAIPAFEKALSMQNLEHHDRILSLQYAAYSAMAVFDQLKDDAREEKARLFNKALDFCFEGTKQDPNRAEFHVVAADAYLRARELAKAVPHYSAAKSCIKNFDSAYEGAIYSFRNLYGETPTLQLAKIYAHLGMLDKAKKEAEECIFLYQTKEAENVLAEIEKVTVLTSLTNGQKDVEDIVISCPPQTAYTFDEEIYKTKPLGGSETALVQMARLLKQKTNRPVKVFNMRDSEMVSDSGVEYIPTTKFNEYLSKFKPHTHIAWRHNIKCTDAKTYLWCHDLVTQGCESKQNFDHMLCLSPFHRNYVQGIQGIPKEKIIVTRNGIDPEKFKFDRPEKNPNKFVYMSSPDRGLDRAIDVMDLVRRDLPEAELHVYYGLENLYKYGHHALAKKLETMIAQRPWVILHGFTEQNQMYREVSDAAVWIHPANFIETYCITAIEMLALGIYPVTRRLGALADTLKEAEGNGYATLLDHDAITIDERIRYAEGCVNAVKSKSWEKIKFNLEENSWDRIADSWVELMHLNLSKEVEVAS